MGAVSCGERAGERLEWALARCRGGGLRRTRALRAVLGSLAGRGGDPVTLAEILGEMGIRPCPDRATLYRILDRLERLRVVRRIGVPDRAAHYILLAPGEHHDFLVCVRCGEIERLEIECPVGRLERAVTRATGYREVYHDLEFFGVCPRCGRGG